MVLCAAAVLSAMTPAKPAAKTRAATTRVSTATRTPLRTTKATAAQPAKPVARRASQQTAGTVTARSVVAKPVSAKSVTAKPVIAKPVTAKPAGKKTVRATYRPVQRFPFKLVSSPSLDGMPEMVPPLENLGLHELGDSFAAMRMGRLRHNAIDIMRPLGDPLIAVVDGVVEKLYNSRLGGITLYLLDKDKRFRFYYAHLDRYAEGIEEGMEIQKGDVLGYVGKTGNARWTDPHLHFQVMTTEATGSWWKAAAVLNPYPILRDVVKRQLAALPQPFVGPVDITIEEPPKR